MGVEVGSIAVTSLSVSCSRQRQYGRQPYAHSTWSVDWPLCRRGGAKWTPPFGAISGQALVRAAVDLLLRRAAGLLQVGACCRQTRGSLHVKPLPILDFGFGILDWLPGYLDAALAILDIGLEVLGWGGGVRRIFDGRLLFPPCPLYVFAGDVFHVILVATVRWFPDRGFLE
jgi:hypothetical protein